jgi:hypothetical protein
LGSRYPDSGSSFLHADGSIKPGYHARYNDDEFPGESAASFALDLPQSPELAQVLRDQPGNEVLYHDDVWCATPTSVEPLTPLRKKEEKKRRKKKKIRSLKKWDWFP